MLVRAVAAESVGQGVLVATVVFYMLRIVGLSAAEVGLGVTIGVIVGVAVSVPVGVLADRTNPLTAAVALTALRAGPVIGYTLVNSFSAYLLVAVLQAITFSGARVTGAAMIPTVFPVEACVRARAAARVTTNIGMTAGVGIGAAAVVLGSGPAYRVLYVAAGAALVLAAFLFRRLRRYQHTPESAGSTPAPPRAERAAAPRRVDVLRDRPYLAVTVITTLLATCDPLLVVGLPLWISEATDAPRWIYPVAIAVNTIGVAVLQLRLSRLGETTVGAGRALRAAGAALAVACLLWGTAGQATAAWVAAALVLGGTVAHLLGELTFSAGGWGVSYGLAPNNAHGQYQGVYETGIQLAAGIMPVVAGVFLISHGLVGWSIVGLVMLLAGLLAPVTVAWALRWPARARYAAG
jgi:MFS family permease